MYHNSTLRDRITGYGFQNIKKLENEIADKIRQTDQMSQQDLLILQQKTTTYANTINMLSTITKSLSDSDREVIRSS